MRSPSIAMRAFANGGPPAPSIRRPPRITVFGGAVGVVSGSVANASAKAGRSDNLDLLAAILQGFGASNRASTAPAGSRITAKEPPISSRGPKSTFPRRRFAAVRLRFRLATAT